MVLVSKTEAAKRQLDTAIHLLFDGADQLSIRTLAGAAFNVLADLKGHDVADISWRSRLIADSGMPEGKAISVLNATQNFLKHADRDPDSMLEFDEEENHDVLFVATLECGALGVGLSAPMQAFQVWFLNLYSSRFTSEGQHFIQVRFPGPDISCLSTQDRLRYGKELINEAKLLSPADVSPS